MSEHNEKNSCWKYSYINIINKLAVENDISYKRLVRDVEYNDCNFIASLIKYYDWEEFNNFLNSLKDDKHFDQVLEDFSEDIFILKDYKNIPEFCFENLIFFGIDSEDFLTEERVINYEMYKYYKHEAGFSSYLWYVNKTKKYKNFFDFISSQEWLNFFYNDDNDIIDLIENYLQVFFEDCKIDYVLEDLKNVMNNCQILNIYLNHINDNCYFIEVDKYLKTLIKFGCSVDEKHIEFFTEDNNYQEIKNKLEEINLLISSKNKILKQNINFAINNCNNLLIAKKNLKNILTKNI